MLKLTAKQILALQKLRSNSFSYNIPVSILNSLERKGLIERTGDWYHWLTDTGAQALYGIEKRNEE